MGKYPYRTGLGDAKNLIVARTGFAVIAIGGANGPFQKLAMRYLITSLSLL